MRSAKLSANRDAYSIYGDVVEIVVVDDLVGGIFPDVFKGEKICLQFDVVLTSETIDRRSGWRHSSGCTVSGQSCEC